jgi:O-acetyl-ADP-ribose deacetylase (regulator of RNase III)
LDSRIEIAEGDITKFSVDAIVNAANTSLLGGGGVDGAIHRAAGPELEFACRMLHGCKTGEAKITKGFRLPAKYILHTVGPVWRGGANGGDELLATCYRNCFGYVTSHDLKTLAFPAISTGVYHFPIDRATVIALRETENFLARNDALEKVIFVCFGAEVLRSYQQGIISENLANGKT